MTLKAANVVVCPGEKPEIEKNTASCAWIEKKQPSPDINHVVHPVRGQNGQTSRRPQEADRDPSSLPSGSSVALLNAPESSGDDC